MYDADFPPFWEIVGYLSCIVLSVVMLLVLLRIILFPGVWHSPLAVWGLLLGFCILIGYAGSRLVQELFPARMGRCRVCSLIRKVIEIE